MMPYQQPMMAPGQQYAQSVPQFQAGNVIPDGAKPGLFQSAIQMAAQNMFGQQNPQNGDQTQQGYGPVPGLFSQMPQQQKQPDQPNWMQQAAGQVMQKMMPETFADMDPSKMGANNMAGKATGNAIAQMCGG